MVKKKNDNAFKKKLKQIDKAYSLESAEAKRAVAVDFVIDTNKRTPKNQEPRMSD